MQFRKIHGNVFFRVPKEHYLLQLLLFLCVHQWQTQFLEMIQNLFYWLVFEINNFVLNLIKPLPVLGLKDILLSHVLNYEINFVFILSQFPHCLLLYFCYIRGWFLNTRVVGCRVGRIRERPGRAQGGYSLPIFPGCHYRRRISKFCSFGERCVRRPDWWYDLGQLVSRLLYRCMGQTAHNVGGGICQDFLGDIVPDRHRRVNYLGPFSS